MDTVRVQRAPLRRSLVVFICLGALLAGVAWGIGQQSGSAASPKLVLDAPQEVLAGEPIEIRMTIDSANGISGFDVTIGFDTTVAELQGFDPQANDLKKLGRDVQALGPVEVPGGIAVGAYSCPFDDCTDVAGKKRNKQDGKGTLRLTTFTIVADQPGPLTIDLTSARFTDGTGTLVDVDLSAAVVTVLVVANGGGE